MMIVLVLDGRSGAAARSVRASFDEACRFTTGAGWEIS
jgi:hypothetical protein